MYQNTAVDDSLLPEEYITPANQRLTSKFLTKFEIAAAVSLRARDIISGQFKYGRSNANDDIRGRTIQGDEKEVASRNVMKKRKNESSSSSDSDEDTDGKNIKNSSSSNNNNNSQQQQQQEDDNPMNSIDNQARVKSLPMIFSDPVMIAKHELVNKKLPFIVKRCIGADLPPQNVLNGGNQSQRYRVEIIPIDELEVDIRSIDLGDWIF